MTAWTYLAADLTSGRIIDELPLVNVRMSKVLNGAGQLHAQIRLGDPAVQARDIYDLTRPVRRCVYAIRDARPWWGGIIWASDYDEDTHTVDLGCADFWSYFDHRKVLEVLSAPPWAMSYIAGFAKIYTQVDQNDIARGLVSLAQGHPGGNIGITTDTALSGILRDRTYQGFDLDYTGQALRDLAAVSDGPDIAFDLGGLDTSGRPARIMRTGTPRLGQQGSPHRWDLGGNMLSYTWSSGGGVMATRTYAQGDGSDRGTLIAVAEDTTRYADGWPLLETDDIFQGTTLATTLQGDANTLLGGLKLPLTTPTMTVRGDTTPTLGDFAVGDDGRMVIPVGNLLFPAGLDLPIRIMNIDVAITEQGLESVKLGCQSQQTVV